MKSDIVHARVDSQIKIESEQILNILGISLSQAIDLFLRQIIIKKGLPFKLDTELSEDELELNKVIKEFSKGLDLLDDYDHQRIIKPQGNKTIYKLEYKEARNIINKMKFSTSSNLFGKEKEEGKLNGILEAVYQDVFGEEVYKTIEEKAAHLLYFLVKDHPFVDGCKRIAALLFLQFLNKNKRLITPKGMLISNSSLVSLTLLIAESKPEEKDLIISILVNLLNPKII